MPSFLSHGAAQLRRTYGELRSGTFLGAARARARRRRSPWNLLLPLFTIPTWLFLWWSSFKVVWRMHVFFYPGHAGLLHSFWPSGLPLREFVPSVLMVVPAAFPTLVWAMILANGLLWLIPPARQAFEKEAKGSSGTDFKSAQSSLLLVAAGLTAGWALLATIGAATLHKVG